MDLTKKDRPAANRAANQEHSGENFEATSSLPESADTRCRRCGRVLHSEKAIEAGAGWRCLARLAAEAVVA